MYTRTADVRDIARIVEIDAAFYGDHGYGRYAVRQFIDLFPQSVFVSEDDGRITGYAILGIEGLSKRAWLLSVAVDTADQRKGAGAALMQCCLSFCEEHGIESCALTVKADNVGAIALYKKNVFAVTHGPLDYYGDGEPRVVMEKRWD